MKILNLKKKINNNFILNEISFEFKRGQIVALIGANGSGKTTLLNCLAGVISYEGEFDERPKSIGICISRKGFFDDMTVNQQLTLYGKLILANEFNLEVALRLFSIDFGERRFGTLSAGMKQRVALTLAFIGKCELIILDEPTNHLDIDSIRKLWTLVSSYSKTGSTFVIASPMIAEMEKTADHILFLKDGTVVLEGQNQKLVDQFGSLEEAYLSTNKAL